MATIGRKLVQRRLFCTIIPRETVKPFSPTPSDLLTYHLSVLDQLVPIMRIPLVFFYPNNASFCSSTAEAKSHSLKESLSQSLTKYYPFAGRFSTLTTPCIDCNDEGVQFLEPCIDRPLQDFIHQKLQDETLDQLFPENHQNSTSPLEVQVNHFTCGGLAVALSMSHKVGDASTLATFVNHWATVARHGSVHHEQVLPINPHFLSFAENTKVDFPQVVPKESHEIPTMKFLFPNSKLDVLKSKVIDIANPTRFEVLTSLLFKSEVTAALATNPGRSTPSALFYPVNLRKKMKLPDTSVGNIIVPIVVVLEQASDLPLNALIAELRKGMMELEGIRDVEEAAVVMMKMWSKLGDSTNSMDNLYGYSSFCGFPFYKTDFGWGKPIRATLLMSSALRNSNVSMDTPCGDGIEVLAKLRKEDMAIFQNDKELLEFCS